MKLFKERIFHALKKLLYLILFLIFVSIFAYLMMILEAKYNSFFIDSSDFILRVTAGIVLIISFLFIIGKAYLYFIYEPFIKKETDEKEHTE